MIIDSDTIVSISEANQNFSKVARMVDQYGSVTIMKNNAPRYILLDFNDVEKMQNASNEDVLSSSEKFIQKNKKSVFAQCWCFEKPIRLFMRFI